MYLDLLAGCLTSLTFRVYINEDKRFLHKKILLSRLLVDFPNNFYKETKMRKVQCFFYDSKRILLVDKVKDGTIPDCSMVVSSLPLPFVEELLRNNENILSNSDRATLYNVNSENSASFILDNYLDALVVEAEEFLKLHERLVDYYNDDDIVCTY
jgi:hypothetical protein